jgi:zeaxanthin glucosyltransferase
MKTALFIMLPSASHFHASFGLAKHYHKLGYSIIYTGTIAYKDLVERQGFQFHAFRYCTEYFITTIKGFFALLLKNLIDANFLEKRYREFLSEIWALETLKTQLTPDQVFIDEHLSEYGLFFENEKTTIICTKLSSRKADNIPPMNSYFFPNLNWWSKYYCAWLWYKRWLSKLSKKWLHRFAFLGKDDAYFFERYLCRRGINTKVMIDEKNYHFKGIKGLKRVILGTSRLEIPWRPVFDDESYFLPEITRNEQKYFSDAYLDLIAQIRHIPNDSDMKVVYCSFGTVAYKDTSRVHEFMKKLLQAKPEYPNVILVISKGNLAMTLKTIHNVYYFDFLPQLHFLPHCHLMITHGGHNSVKECLQFDVPMLVYPHMEDNDQPGNAVRVELNGFGTMGNLQKDSPAQIWHKIASLLAKKTAPTKSLAFFEPT